MEYTAQGESQVANIVQGEAEWYIFVTRLSPSAVYYYTNKVSVLSILLYFTLKYVLTKDLPLKFNEQTKSFFDKNVSIVLPFYNYSSVL